MRDVESRHGAFAICPGTGDVALLHHGLQCAKALPLSRIDTLRGHVPSAVHAEPHLERRRSARIMKLWSERRRLSKNPDMSIRSYVTRNERAITFLSQTRQTRAVIFFPMLEAETRSEEAVTRVSTRSSLDSQRSRRRGLKGSRPATKDVLDHITAPRCTSRAHKVLNRVRRKRRKARKVSRACARARNRKSKET